MPRPALRQHITYLDVRDLTASARFYEQALGLILARDQGGCRLYHLGGEAYLGLCQREAAHDASSDVVLTLVTDQVDEWYASLSAQGVAFTQPPTADPQRSAYRCQLRDPDGHQLEILRFDEALMTQDEPALSVPSTDTTEPPTTIQLVTVSQAGWVKRTPRHLYERQRRGGMGIFDIEVNEDDAPRALALADASQALIWLTNYARAFRLPMSDWVESPVRGRGQAIGEKLPLLPGEHVALALPAQARGNLAVLTHTGYVRCLPAHIVGPAMRPGADLYKFIDFGHLISACWTFGDGDLFIATRQGLALRFPERQVPLAGGQGIRLEAGDAPVAVAAVRPESGVFLLGADGLGTIRLMSGFNANKAPGAGGKQALKTEKLVGAVTVAARDDVFIISRLSKIIRFRADEVPAKEGVVQGVHCMALRADETAAVTLSPVRED